VINFGRVNFTEGLPEQRAEENICTENNRRIDRITSREANRSCTVGSNQIG
jgi:hypothetical protein